MVRPATGDPAKVKKIVHFEFDGDPSSATEITVYEDGGKTAYTWATTDRLLIKAISVSAAAAVAVRVFFDEDDDNAVDAGELIVGLHAAANGGIVKESFSPPRGGGANTRPHVLSTGAGNVIITGEGYIVAE